MLHHICLFFPLILYEIRLWLDEDVYVQLVENVVAIKNIPSVLTV